MSRLNVPNRTLAIMDNLRFLRSLNNECIDLIAIDPPFATNETFIGQPKPPISDAEMTEERALAESHGARHNEGVGDTRVRDVWSWDDDVHPAWKARIQFDYPAVFAVIEAVEASASENEAAYLAYMAVRLIECYRVLKPTGSIYVHCNSHANSYLRMLLDSIFDAENFRNEIVWHYGKMSNPSRNFPANHDTLLRYTKTNDFTFRPIKGAESEYRERFKRHLTGNTVRYGRVKHLSDKLILGRITKRSKELGRSLTDEDVLFDFDSEFKVQSDVIYVPIIKGNARERTGYATQKPLALYERIIEASSNPGEVVLDIFAGCATTAVAAERLGREWIACDMAYRSWTMLKRRFYLNGYALAGMTDSTREALGEHQTEIQEAESRTIGPDDIPSRDDTDPAPHHSLTTGRRRRGKISTQTASWSGKISTDAAKELLIERFGPVCWGCGYLPRRPNGSIDDTLLEVDHIRARRPTVGTPGDDELYNLALLHRTCNGIKRNSMTLEQLREHNALNGLLYVNGPNDLIDLFEATRFANEQIAIHAASYGVQESLASYDAG